jgi:hypothetical protein
MNFCRANWSVQNEIDKRADLEAWKAWAATPTPQWVPMPDETQYKAPEPPFVALYNFIRGLRP